MDISRLIKLLNLTTSDNDHEALSAIRMANALVGGDWESLLANRGHSGFSRGYEEPPRRSQPRPDSVDVAKILSIIESRLIKLGSSGVKWHKILHDSFVAKGFLTPRQMEVLNAMYEESLR